MSENGGIPRNGHQNIGRWWCDKQWNVGVPHFQTNPTMKQYLGPLHNTTALRMAHFGPGISFPSSAIWDSSCILQTGSTKAMVTELSEAWCCWIISAIETNQLWVVTRLFNKPTILSNFGEHPEIKPRQKHSASIWNAIAICSDVSTFIIPNSSQNGTTKTPGHPETELGMQLPQAKLNMRTKLDPVHDVLGAEVECLPRELVWVCNG